MANVVVWADIPVLDMERAREFYSHLLQAPVDLMPGMTTVALLRGPGEPDPMVVSADLAVGQSMPSTSHGCTIYLSSLGDIDGMLRRAVEAGGAVLAGKAKMDMIGWIAFIKDTEGNRVGIHEPAQTG
jgi:predicted enzyme related to lactoylglutathione lyase